uniref:CSON007872 protein n=1 Tax=Culicoides sonorensis TaxID=179676 RepID=A0A336MXD1_CULSO
MEKIIANTATKISLNDRFTIISKAKPTGQVAATRKLKANQKRIGAGSTGAGSLRNRRLVENLEKRLKFQAALKIKNKSIRGGRIQRKNTVRQLANRLKRNARQGGGIKKRLSMNADLVQNQARGRRQRSGSVSSVHSRLGVRGIGGRRNSNANVNTPRQGRRLKRSNSVSNLKRSASNGNLARSQSRSNLQRTNSNMNLNGNNRQQRNRSRSRNRMNQNNQNNGQVRRRLNRNFAGGNLKRSNSQKNLATKARFGINRNANPINMRRNRRKINGGQSIGRSKVRGNQQQQQQQRQQNKNQNGNVGGRGRSKTRGGPANNQQQRRGRSRTRRTDNAKPQQTKEQLDRELDLYMAKSKNSAQSELDQYMNSDANEIQLLATTHLNSINYNDERNNKATFNLTYCFI